jgi:superkiller protein 3
MANVKAALKAAKAAIDSNKFQEAAEQSRSILETDPDNYFA